MHQRMATKLPDLKSVYRRGIWQSGQLTQQDETAQTYSGSKNLENNPSLTIKASMLEVRTG